MVFDILCVVPYHSEHPRDELEFDGVEHASVMFSPGNLPLEDDIAWCCGIVIRYFQAPVDSLMTLHDRFGLTDILLAADRRIGKRRWPEIYATRSEVAQKVLVARGYVPPAENEAKLEAEIQNVLDTFAASNTALNSL